MDVAPVPVRTMNTGRSGRHHRHKFSGGRPRKEAAPFPSVPLTMIRFHRLGHPEALEVVVEQIRAWRGSVLTMATRGRRRSTANLALVRVASSDGALAARGIEGELR